MPEPGKEVWMRCPGENDTSETVCVKRSADLRLDKVVISMAGSSAKKSAPITN